MTPVGSLLQLNPHGHALVPDAVWFDGPDGELASCELPPPTDDEVEGVGIAIVKAVLRIVARAADRAALELDDEPAMPAPTASAPSSPPPMPPSPGRAPGTACGGPSCSRACSAIKC